MNRWWVAVLLTATVVHAREVGTDQNGGVLDLSGFFKNFATGLLLQENTARSAGVPRTGFLDANIARVAAKFRLEGRVEFEAAYQLTFLAVSNPLFVGGASLSGSIGGTGVGPQRRLVPLGGTLVQGNVTRLDHDLDRLALKFALPFGDLTIGRQVLSWGTGRFFNPTDVLSPFPPTAIDKEVRRGFDAVRLAVALGDTTQLDLLYLPQPLAEDMGGVARFQTNLAGFDGSLSVGKYVRDLVFGADFVGDVGPVGVHGEGAYTLEVLSTGVGDHFFRGVLGADFKPHELVIVTAEYSYNGYGTTDPSKYAAILTSRRALRGEVFGAGKHVGALAISYRANDLVSTSVSVLCNVTDPSALAFASAEWSVLQWVLLRGGVYVPIGKPPSLGALRSEYGSSSYGLFLQLAAYVP